MQRDRAWQPLIRFVLVGPRGDAAVIDWFATEFDQFLSDRRVEAERLADTELFDRWSAILRAKEGLQTLLKEPIAFHGARADGARLPDSSADIWRKPRHISSLSKNHAYIAIWSVPMVSNPGGAGPH